MFLLGNSAQANVKNFDGNMKIFNRSTLATALITVVCFLQPRLAHAGGEGFSKDAMGDSKETIDTKSDLGLGKFSSFPFHVTVAVRGGYDDNVNLSSFDEQGSAFVSTTVGLSYDFGSPRTKLSLSAGGGFTYYLDRDDNNGGFLNGNDSNDDFDVNGYIAFAITHKATPRLTLAANVYASYQSQPNFDSFNRGGLGFSRQNQDYFYSINKFSVAYAWTPKFSTVTSYSLGVVDYDSEVVSTFEDRFEHTFGNEFRFLVLPTTTLVAEYRFGIVDYNDTNNRGSTSHFLLAGLDHSFSPRFSVSARGGVEFREFDNDGFFNHEGDETSPYAEGTVNYAIAQNTSLSWSNRYSLEEPDVPDSFSRTTFRTALSLRHSFTSRIVAGLSVAYQHDDNDGSLGFDGFEEDSYDVLLSLRYAISRNWAIDVGYNHTEVVSDESLFREFSRNRVYGGVSFTF